MSFKHLVQPADITARACCPEQCPGSTAFDDRVIPEARLPWPGHGPGPASEAQAAGRTLALVKLVPQTLPPPPFPRLGRAEHSLWINDTLRGRGSELKSFPTALHVSDPRRATV